MRGDSQRWTTALNRMADDSFLKSLDNYPAMPVASPGYIVESPKFAPPSPSLIPRTREPSARAALVSELLDSERRFLKDLQAIQSYAHSLIQTDVNPQSTVFAAVNNMLDVQPAFADGLESTAAIQPWADQNWGAHFELFNEDFRVYADYGLALGNAHLAIEAQTPLNQTRSMLPIGGDIPSILAPPLLRMDFYATFLQNIIKYIPNDSPSRPSALNALVITRRHLNTVYTSYRTAKNACISRSLHSRVRDWKGLDSFQLGKLVLEGRFPVQLANTTTESVYHVFLFEKIILCCRDTALVSTQRVAEVNKTMAKLCGPGNTKRSPSPPNTTAPGEMVLKGRISLRDLTQMMARGSRGNYELGIWWGSGANEPESQIIMLFREEELLKIWEGEIKSLKRNTGAFEDDWTVGRGPARGGYA